MRLPSSDEQQSLIALAREKGLDAVTFLELVMKGKQTELAEVKPIPLSLRIAAADLLRKYAALPTNVALEMTVATKLEYIGDRDVTPMLPARHDD
jgi:hypothetical protein